MKPYSFQLTIIAISIVSFSVFAYADDNAFDNAISARNQAKFNSAVADANEANAIAAYNSPARFNSDGTWNQATITAGDNAIKATDAAHVAQAIADSAVNGSTMKVQALAQQGNIIGAALVDANQQRTQQQVNALSASRYGVKGNPDLTSQYSQPASSTINVSAGSLAPATSVTAKVNGKPIQTTAGALAKINPQLQVAIPHVNAIIGAPQRSANDHSRNRSRSEQGAGNGSNNAANSRSANGLGGGNHIGGGSAQSGSRNVGHW